MALKEYKDAIKAELYRNEAHKAATKRYMELMEQPLFEDCDHIVNQLNNILDVCAKQYPDGFAVQYPSGNVTLYLPKENKTKNNK